MMNRDEENVEIMAEVKFLKEIQAEGKAFPCVDVVAVKENQLTETKEHQEPLSLMAQEAEQKNEKCKITKEKPEVVERLQKLSLQRNADTDLQSMDTAHMLPTNTRPSTDLREVNTKSRNKRDRLRRLTLESEEWNRQNKELKATRIQKDPESNAGSLPIDLCRGLLPVKGCRKIKENLVFLTDELVPDHFMPYLYSNDVLNDEQREQLMEELDNHGRKKCTETLLYILIHVCSETRAYELFCQCLREKKYYQALKKLEPNSTDITDEQLKTSKGKLPEKECSLIQEHIELLTQSIAPSQYITRLYSRKVFSEEDCEQLKNIKAKTPRVDAMLFILLRCGKFGFKQFLLYLKEHDPSVFKILYPGNTKDQLTVKYLNEKYEVVSNTENVKHIQFIDRVTSNWEEYLPRTLVTVHNVKKGCVQVTFEIHSLDKTDKEELRAVLEKAMKSGYIGPDAISNLEFKPIDDDELTDEEVEKEIQMLEEENARLRQEHQRLLALPLKKTTPLMYKGFRIPDKKTDPTKYQLLESFLATSKKYWTCLEEVIRNRQAIVVTLEIASKELKKEALTSATQKVLYPDVLHCGSAAVSGLPSLTERVDRRYVDAVLQSSSEQKIVTVNVEEQGALPLDLIAQSGSSPMFVATGPYRKNVFPQKALETEKLKLVDEMFKKDNSLQISLDNLENMFYVKYTNFELRFQELISQIIIGSKELALLINDYDRKNRRLFSSDSKYNHDLNCGYIFLSTTNLDSLIAFLSLFAITNESELADKFLQLAQEIENNLQRANNFAGEVKQLVDELSRLLNQN